MGILFEPEFDMSMLKLLERSRAILGKYTTSVGSMGMKAFDGR